MRLFAIVLLDVLPRPANHPVQFVEPERLWRKEPE
jgi:hypothetical protein